MAFEARRPGGSRYMYVSRRDPLTGKVKKVYLGRGRRADAAAAELELRRQQRLAERDANRRAEADLRGVDGMIAELNAAVVILLEAELLAAGFHRANYSRWRKRRNGDGHGGHAGATARWVG